MLPVTPALTNIPALDGGGPAAPGQPGDFAAAMLATRRGGREGRSAIGSEGPVRAERGAAAAERKAGQDQSDPARSLAIPAGLPVFAAVGVAGVVDPHAGPQAGTAGRLSADPAVSEAEKPPFSPDGSTSRLQSISQAAIPVSGVPAPSVEDASPATSKDNGTGAGAEYSSAVKHPANHAFAGPANPVGADVPENPGRLAAAGLPAPAAAETSTAEQTAVGDRPRAGRIDARPTMQDRGVIARGRLARYEIHEEKGRQSVAPANGLLPEELEGAGAGLSPEVFGMPGKTRDSAGRSAGQARPGDPPEAAMEKGMPFTRTVPAGMAALFEEDGFRQSLAVDGPVRSGKAPRFSGAGGGTVRSSALSGGPGIPAEAIDPSGPAASPNPPLTETVAAMMAPAAWAEDIQGEAGSRVQKRVPSASGETPASRPGMAASTADFMTLLREEAHGREVGIVSGEASRSGLSATSQQQISLTPDRRSGLPSSFELLLQPGAKERAGDVRQEFFNFWSDSASTSTGAARPAEPGVAVPPAPAYPGGPDGVRIADQVISRVKLVGSGGETNLSLTLHPRELGEVRVELVADKDGLRAHLHSQNQQVQAALESHLPRLREAFAAQGLKVHDLQVSCDGSRNGGGAFQHGRDLPYRSRTRVEVGGGGEPVRDWPVEPPPAVSGWASQSGFSLRV